MNNAKYFRIALTLLVISLAAAQTPEPRLATLSAASATIVELKGNVSVRTPQGQSSQAQRGQVVAAEDTIDVAKGSAVLNLQDGSQVLIKAHTRVVIKSPDQGNGTYLNLLLGKIMAQVRKRIGNAPSFKLGTPSAVITVRGTRFSVEVSKRNKTIVDVFEGIVDVAGVDIPGEPVQLRPGFSTEVEPSRRPEQPRGFGGAAGRTSTSRSDQDHQGPFVPGMSREAGDGGSSGGGFAGSGDESGSSAQRPRSGDGTTTSSPMDTSTGQDREE